MVFEPNRFMADGAIGRWLFRGQNYRTFITGLAPTAELHYTYFAESVFPDLYSGRLYDDQFSRLNATAGLTAETHLGVLGLGFVAPLLNNVGGSPFAIDRGRGADWNFALQYNARW